MTDKIIRNQNDGGDIVFVTNDGGTDVEAARITKDGIPGSDVEAASDSNDGVITTGTQAFAGNKTFQDIEITNQLTITGRATSAHGADSGLNSTTPTPTLYTFTAANQMVLATVHRRTGPGLTRHSIAIIVSDGSSNILITTISENAFSWNNHTGSSIRVESTSSSDNGYIYSVLRIR